MSWGASLWVYPENCQGLIGARLPKENAAIDPMKML